MCSAETAPKELFGAGGISQRDHEANMNLMDDLGIHQVN